MDNLRNNILTQQSLNAKRYAQPFIALTVIFVSIITRYFPVETKNVCAIITQPQTIEDSIASFLDRSLGYFYVYFYKRPLLKSYAEIVCIVVPAETISYEYYLTLFITLFFSFVLLVIIILLAVYYFLKMKRFVPTIVEEDGLYDKAVQTLISMRYNNLDRIFIRAEVRDQFVGAPREEREAIVRPEQPEVVDQPEQPEVIDLVSDEEEAEEPETEELDLLRLIQ